VTRAVPPQPTGTLWRDWAIRLVTYLNLIRSRLQFKATGDRSSEDGIILWDSTIGHPVVSLDNVFEPLSYGENINAAFYTTATHSAAVVDTAYAITWENTALANDKITIADSPNTSRIVFDHGGTYQINFSAELLSSNSSAKSIYIWPRINGVDVPFSTIVTSIDANGQMIVVSRSGIFEVEEDDYLEAMFAVTDTDLAIDGSAATAFAPAAPSASIIITEIR
jgi:hypothetical protein